MADLEDFIPTSDTFDVTIVHPNTLEPLTKDDGSEMTVTLYHKQSPQHKAEIRRQTNKRLQKAKGKKQNLTAEDIETLSVDLLVNTTKSWSIQLSKKDVKFDAETARDVYNRISWLKDQLLEALEEYNGFLKN